MQVIDQENSYVVQQVRSNSVIIFDQPIRRRGISDERVEMLKAARKCAYSGEVSVVTAKKLKEQITVWYNSTVYFNKYLRANQFEHKKKLVFITLTLPSTQLHSDKDIKLLILKPFVRILKDRFNLENYLWKAESQQNGNIHFHLVTDIYLDKSILQTLWNSCADKLGYLSSFERKFKHRNAPSTDIQIVNDLNQAVLYLVKYIVKSEKYRKIEGAVIYRSKSMNKLKYYSADMDNEQMEIYQNAARLGQLEIIVKDRYSIILIKLGDVSKYLSSYNLRNYGDHLREACFLLHYITFDRFATTKKLNLNSNCTPLDCRLSAVNKAVAVVQLKLFSDFGFY